MLKKGVDEGAVKKAVGQDAGPGTDGLGKEKEKKRERKSERTRERKRKGERERGREISCYLAECSISAGFTLQDSLLGGERLASCLLLLPLLLTQPGLQLLQLLLIAPVLALQELHLLSAGRQDAHAS